MELLRESAHGPWEGQVHRHMFAGYPPDRENTGGARWNPAGIPAIYTSLERATSMAEAEYHLSLQPIRPRVRRTMYVIRVELKNIIQLAMEDLELLGLQAGMLGSFDLEPCQRFGGCGRVAWTRWAARSIRPNTGVEPGHLSGKPVGTVHIREDR